MQGHGKVASASTKETNVWLFCGALVLKLEPGKKQLFYFLTAEIGPALGKLGVVLTASSMNLLEDCIPGLHIKVRLRLRCQVCRIVCQAAVTCVNEEGPGGPSCVSVIRRAFCEMNKYSWESESLFFTNSDEN